MPDAFPLHWPEGWPRTQIRNRYSRFKGNTFARARDGLAAELDRLGAKDEILSTNVPLRLDGAPRGDFRDVIADPGVAVYFTLNKRPMVMARDEYSHVSDNVRSLALAVEYLRGMRRHGGAAMMERAFAGFAALNAPGHVRSCWEVLGISAAAATKTVVNMAYQQLARQHHPDVGGTEQQMAEINNARDQALRELGA